ncbi:MAG: D-alanine--D-alanine ligase [Candidatus Gracilibacteria bacterium]
MKKTEEGDDPPGGNLSLKGLTVAFLYNVRHRYPNPDDPTTYLETDFDDPPSIKAMIKNLKSCGCKVIPIEANEKAYLKLYKNRKKIDVVWNFSEGLNGRDRECQLPAMMEMLGIPYTGSSPLTQAIILNKVRTKEILSLHSVPVLPHQVFAGVGGKLRDEFKFPLIVKPVSQGSSAGITDASVVKNDEELRAQLGWIFDHFGGAGGAAMIEPFLRGREFSCSMIGNPPVVLPIIESSHSMLPKNLNPIDSLEVKWIIEEEIDINKYLTCPAKIDGGFKKKLEDICRKTWDALGVFDWCRVDIRCDEEGNPFVLEVNSPPGCQPPEISLSSYFPIAARAVGVDYPSLLKKLINITLKRYKNENHN